MWTGVASTSPTCRRIRSSRTRSAPRPIEAAERNGVVYVYMGAAEKAPPCPTSPRRISPRARRPSASRCANAIGCKGSKATSTPRISISCITARQAPRLRANRRGALRPDPPRSRISGRRARARHHLWRLSPGGERLDLLAHRAFPVPVLDLGAVHRVRALPHRARLGAARRHAHDVRDDRAEIGAGRGRRDRAAVLPNTTDWLGRYRLTQTAPTTISIDRAAQRTLLLHRHRRHSSAGPGRHRKHGADRRYSFEHLAASDRMLMATRRRLLGAAKALAENGVAPPGSGADRRRTYGRMRGGFFLAPETRHGPMSIICNRRGARCRSDRGGGVTRETTGAARAPRANVREVSP